MSLEIDHALHNLAKKERLSDEALHQFFSQLKPEDIEQFFMAYQLWSQRQQLTNIELQIRELQQKLSVNTTQMERVQPSAIALATLAQLQAYGVEDIDLLDRMLERGDEWLDHSLQLLARCEQLDLIGDDYTQWCEHALEGAYDWIDSITETSTTREKLVETAPVADASTNEALDGAVTEEQLLQMLMSEEGETATTAQAAILTQQARITRPLSLAVEPEQASTEEETSKIAAVTSPHRPSITQPLSTPLSQDELMDGDDDTQLLAAVYPTQEAPALSQQLDAPAPFDTPTSPDETNIVRENEVSHMLITENEIQTLTQADPHEHLENSTETLAMTSTHTTEQNDDDREILEAHQANIDESERSTIASIEPPLKETSSPVSGDNPMQIPYETEVIEPGEQETGIQHRGQTSGEEALRHVETKDLPPPKRMAPARKQGFFRRLLAKILRR